MVSWMHESPRFPETRLTAFQLFCIFHGDMKAAKFLNGEEMEREAVRQLRALLERVPFLRISEMSLSPMKHDGECDVIATVSVGDTEPWTLIVNVKANSRPSTIRVSAVEMHEWLDLWPQKRSYGIVAAHALSEQSQAICREYGLGFIDFTGNARLCFDHIYIETTGRKDRQPSPKRMFKGLFGTRSARVLRLMLRHPQRHWKVLELVAEAEVSAGLVSNIRQSLIEQEWATATEDGLCLTNPDGLLDAWGRAYDKPSDRRETYHTILHGVALKAAIAEAVKNGGNGRHTLLAGVSAAQWLAPYARTGTSQFYADEAGSEALRHHLRLEPTERGANVIIDHPKDEGVFLDRVNPAPDVWCTSPVQTYLDLLVSGERNAEAAAHLRREVLAPSWNLPS